MERLETKIKKCPTCGFWLVEVVDFGPVLFLSHVYDVLIPKVERWHFPTRQMARDYVKMRKALRSVEAFACQVTCDTKDIQSKGSLTGWRRC